MFRDMRREAFGQGRAAGSRNRTQTGQGTVAADAVGCRTVITGDSKDHSSRDIIARIRGEGECGS